jgi:hypothetical protein
VARRLPGILLVLAVCVPALTVSAFEQPYYYFQGKKIHVDPTSRIAVRPLQGVEASDVFKTVLGPSVRFSTTQLEEHRLWLVDLHALLKPADLLLASRRFASHPGVEFAAPVFSTATEELVLLDEFIVKFKESVRDVEIARFNAANSVIVARKGPGPDTLVLKVTARSKLNALEMANLYYEQGVTVYSQPNFLRVSQR